MDEKKQNVAIFGVGVVGIPVLREILNRLSAHVEITVYSFVPVKSTDLIPGIRMRCMPRFPIHQRLQYLVLGIWFVMDHFRTRYHILHAQSAFPAGVLTRALSKLFGIPWLLTLIGGEVEAMPDIPFGTLLDKKLRQITYKVCSEANRLTVMSGYQAASVAANLNLHRSIQVLPYAPLSKPLNEKKITFPVRFLHVANYHPVKNHDMLLSAISRLKDQIPFELTIVGANYDEKFLEKVKTLHLMECIKIEGARSYEEMEMFYESAHILLHTSWYEGLPTVAFEAMAYGTVVCGTHVGIMADLSETHFVTTGLDDDAAFAKAVLDLVKDPARYQTLRNKSHAWATENDANHYVSQMMTWYRQLIKASE